jgi:hypothetical protein
MMEAATNKQPIENMSKKKREKNSKETKKKKKISISAGILHVDGGGGRLV